MHTASQYGSLNADAQFGECVGPGPRKVGTVSPEWEGKGGWRDRAGVAGNSDASDPHLKRTKFLSSAGVVCSSSCFLQSVTGVPESTRAAKGPRAPVQPHPPPATMCLPRTPVDPPRAPAPRTNSWDPQTLPGKRSPGDALHPA